MIGIHFSKTQLWQNAKSQDMICVHVHFYLMLMKGRVSGEVENVEVISLTDFKIFPVYNSLLLI